jgi:hypothetical protein
MSKQEEEVALEALRRMNQKERDFALAFLIRFAPARQSTPLLKLVSNRTG